MPRGKTNILEALYLAGTTKSHRGSKDREIIQFDREGSPYPDDGGAERQHA